MTLQAVLGEPEVWIDLDPAVGSTPLEALARINRDVAEGQTDGIWLLAANGDLLNLRHVKRIVVKPVNPDRAWLHGGA